MPASPAVSRSGTSRSSQLRPNATTTTAAAVRKTAGEPILESRRWVPKRRLASHLYAHKARPPEFLDGPGRNRTCDLGIKSPLLCQLSYRPAG
jgi:hypothetical protein